MDRNESSPKSGIGLFEICVLMLMLFVALGTVIVLPMLGRTGRRRHPASASASNISAIGRAMAIQAISGDIGNTPINHHHVERESASPAASIDAVSPEKSEKNVSLFAEAFKQSAIK